MENNEAYAERAAVFQLREDSRTTGQRRRRLINLISSAGNFVYKMFVRRPSLSEPDFNVGRFDSIIATLDANNLRNSRDSTFQDDVQELIEQLSTYLEPNSPAFYLNPISWLYTCCNAWAYVLFITPNEALRNLYHEKVCTKLITLLSHSSVVPTELFKQDTTQPLKDIASRETIFKLRIQPKLNPNQTTQLADFETLWTRCTQCDRLLEWLSTFPELPMFVEYARQYSVQLHNGQENLVLCRLRDIAAELNILISCILAKDQLWFEKFLQSCESPILRAVFKQELLNAATSTNEISRARVALTNTRQILTAMFYRTLPWVSLRPLLPAFQDIPDVLTEILRIHSFALADQVQPLMDHQLTAVAKNIEDALKLMQKLADVRDIVNAIEHMGLIARYETNLDKIIVVEIKPYLEIDNVRYVTMKCITPRIAELDKLFKGVSPDHLTLIKVAFEKHKALELFKKHETLDADVFQALRARLNTYSQYDSQASRLIDSCVSCFLACKLFLKPAQSFKVLLQALRDVHLSPTFVDDFENVHRYAEQIKIWLSGDVFSDSKPEDVVDCVAIVRKNRPIYLNKLPDASVDSLFRTLEPIDLTKVIVPGLDDLAVAKNLKLRLMHAQEQLLKAGNDATPLAIQARNQIRNELGCAIKQLQATLTSDATFTTATQFKGWLRSLKENALLQDLNINLNGVSTVLANAAVRLTRAWINAHEELMQQQIDESELAVEALSELQIQEPITTNTAIASMFTERTEAVMQALRAELRTCYSVSVVPQDIINALKRSGLFAIQTLESVTLRFVYVKAAADDFYFWLRDAEPWLSVDAYPTQVFEDIKTAKIHLDDVHDIFEDTFTLHRRASKRKTATREQLQQMLDAVDQHQQKVAHALHQLQNAQLTAVTILKTHFPELLPHEQIAELAGLDGLKLSSFSMSYFNVKETINGSNGRYKVHKALDLAGNFFALKEYPIKFCKETPTSCQEQREFMREARILQRIKHPAVVVAVSVFHSNNSLYLQMSWCDQGTLAVWARNTRPSHLALQQVFREILQALEFIHLNRVIHGDIKPQNIMMATRQGRMLPQPVLTDFGLAEEMDDPSIIVSSHEAGTPGFIAPELLEGKGKSFASDMFAFGITMVVLFYPETKLGMNAPSLPNNADSALRLLVGRLLSRNPKNRPTAHETQLDAYFVEALHDRRQLPTYWEISMEQANRIVDVTNSLRDSIQALITNTCISAYIGKGRDSHGLTHTGFAVERVDRVENGLMWRAYAERKIQIRCAWEIVESIGDVKTSSFARSTPGGLDNDINEIYAFHGAPANTINTIKSTGLDERVTSHGLFGGGLYFSENSSKSDDYVRPDANGLCYFILARVCMGRVFGTQQYLPGTPYINSTLPRTRRPPCIQQCSLTELCEHQRYDSVRADIGGVLRRYREFVVYDRYQVYPEYIITFRRVRV